MHLQQNLETAVASAVRDFASSMKSGSKVVADMSSLVEVTSQLPLSNFDYWERLVRREFSAQFLPDSNSKWKFWSKAPTLLTWLDLSSPNGYTREKTLRTLTGAAPNSFFFALALRRLNDWVPQVREAARAMLPVIVRASNPKHVVDILCVTLAQWNSWGRLEESGRQILFELISSNDITEAIKSKILSATSGSWTSILAQAGRISVLDAHLGEISKNAIQPSVRAKAYRSQLEGKMVWFEGKKWVWTDIRYCEGHLKTMLSERKLTVVRPFLETLRMASIDRSPIVRRVAADILIRKLDDLGDESLRLATLFASDSSPSVAERGQFVLRKIAAKSC